MTHKCVTVTEGVHVKQGGGKPLDPGTQQRGRLMDKPRRLMDKPGKPQPQEKQQRGPRGRSSAVGMRRKGAQGTHLQPLGTLALQRPTEEHSWEPSHCRGQHRGQLR